MGGGDPGNEEDYIRAAGCKVEDSRATTPSFVAWKANWCNLSRHPFSNWTRIERALSPRSSFQASFTARERSYRVNI